MQWQFIIQVLRPEIAFRITLHLDQRILFIQFSLSSRISRKTINLVPKFS